MNSFTKDDENQGPVWVKLFLNWFFESEMCVTDELCI